MTGISNQNILGKMNNWMTGILMILGILFFSCQQQSKAQKTVDFKINIDPDLKSVSLEFDPKIIVDQSLAASFDLRVKGQVRNVITQKVVDGSTLKLVPPVRLSRDVVYEIYRKGVLADTFIINIKPETSPEIVDIFPIADTLPENLLKIYISFNSPMQTGNVMQYIRVIGGQGDTLEDVLLEMNEELWNEERTRLTVWLHPGRVKRGLIPNEKSGNPLEEGKTYSIHISGEWKSQSGVHLSSSFEKRIFVGPRDEASPNPENWKINAQKDRIIIQFDEPLDYVLLNDNLFAIYDDHHKVIQGKFDVERSGQSITFIPDQEMRQDKYLMEVYSILEDFVGNNLNHEFDRRVDRGNVETKVKVLKFVVE